MYPALLLALSMRNASSCGKSGFDGLSEEIPARADQAGLIGEDSPFLGAVGRLPLGAFLSLEPPLVSHLDNGPIVLQHVQEVRNHPPKVIFPGKIDNEQIGDSLRLGANPMVIRFWRNTAKHVDQHEDTSFELVCIVATVQGFDAISCLTGKKPGIVSLVGKAGRANPFWLAPMRWKQRGQGPRS